MPVRPTQARVRAYNVGFGDCFLLSFDYANGSARHVLIDFGRTERGKKSPNHMADIAEKIAEDCNGKLDMVVASHRHADHISGFAGASGKIIKGLKPEVVLQPWTERPELAPDATAPAPPSGGDATNGARAATARLADMHLIAGLALAEGGRLAGSGARKTALNQLTFLGEENLLNREAVHALAELGTTQLYAHYGMKLPLAKILPGVKVDVLGPPTVEQYAKVKKQVGTHATEFWHLAAATSRALKPGPRRPLFAGEELPRVIPQEARWVIPLIDRMNAEELLSLVRMLDSAMNNTSLILLFDVAGTRLLFSGDAQLENWSYALRDAPNAAKVRARLATTRLYKVGHHGSLNATPKKLLWEVFAQRTDDPADPGRLITLLSTKIPSKHGDEDRGTEVPRGKLLDELRTSSELHNTHDIPTSKEFFLDVAIPL